MKIFNTPRGNYEVYDDIIIARFNEGIELNRKDIPVIVSFMQEHMTKDFGFIADKINSYTINPFIAREIAQEVPHFKFFCNVNYHNESNDLTDIVKNIFPDYVQTNKFDSLSEAILWVKDGLG